MQREIIEFTTEEAWLKERKKDLTSTDIADLFDCGYSNYQELFNRKLKGLDSTFIPNKRSQWGKALEPSIANEFARINNWNMRKKSEYIRIPSLRLGSSFDYEISHEDINDSGIGNSLLEVKNVGVDAYKRDWIKAFSIEAPAKIELQIQTELLVSGLKRCMLCVLVGGNEDVGLIRDANPRIQNAILFKAKEFWGKIDEAKSRA